MYKKLRNLAEAAFEVLCVCDPQHEQDRGAHSIEIAAAVQAQEPVEEMGRLAGRNALLCLRALMLNAPPSVAMYLMNLSKQIDVTEETGETPEPKISGYDPYTKETLLEEVVKRGCFIRSVGDAWYVNPFMFDEKMIGIFAQNKAKPYMAQVYSMTYEEAYNQCLWPDGTPFGKAYTHG